MSVQYFEGVGRRKESIARVRIMSGSGRFIVNEKEAQAYFTRLGDLEAGLGSAATLTFDDAEALRRLERTEQNRQRLADIVLPAASWPELNQLAGLPTIAANVVLAQQKAVQIGECKADEEIFIELARKMNLALGTEPLDEVLEGQLANGCGITLSELRQKGYYKVPFRYGKYKESGFKTPSGKIQKFKLREMVKGARQ